MNDTSEGMNFTHLT